MHLFDFYFPGDFLYLLIFFFKFFCYILWAPFLWISLLQPVILIYVTIYSLSHRDNYVRYYAKWFPFAIFKYLKFSIYRTELLIFPLKHALPTVFLLSVNDNSKHPVPQTICLGSSLCFKQHIPSHQKISLAEPPKCIVNSTISHHLQCHSTD